jgi:hypothetical protein
MKEEGFEQRVQSSETTVGEWDTPEYWSEEVANEELKERFDQINQQVEAGTPVVYDFHSKDKKMVHDFKSAGVRNENHSIGDRMDPGRGFGGPMMEDNEWTPPSRAILIEESMQGTDPINCDTTFYTVDDGEKTKMFSTKYMISRDPAIRTGDNKAISNFVFRLKKLAKEQGNS